MLLSIDEPLEFGKHKGRSPRSLLFGNIHSISFEQQERILNSFNLKRVIELTLSFQVEVYQVKELRIPLPSVRVLQDYTWRMTEAEMIDIFDLEHYALTSRGNDGYIRWLIDSTDYFFEPQDLKQLCDSKIFFPEFLILEYVRTSTDEYQMLLRPKLNFIHPKIPNSLIQLNAEKFDAHTDCRLR